MRWLLKKIQDKVNEKDLQQEVTLFCFMIHQEPLFNIETRSYRESSHESCEIYDQARRLQPLSAVSSLHLWKKLLQNHRDLSRPQANIFGNNAKSDAFCEVSGTC